MVAVAWETAMNICCGCASYEKTQAPAWVIRIAGSLPPQTESPDDRLVALGALLMQVGEQPPPLSDHAEQAATARAVVLGRAEMIGQVLDAVREQCDLDLRGSGILLVATVCLD